MKRNLFTVTLALSLLSAVAQTPRLSLFEEFTGETCPPCAATNPGLNALLSASTNTPKVVAIKWQVPIPSAPTKTWSLYQTNKTEIDWRYTAYGYGINSAPTGRMDGQSPTVFGASSDHPATLDGTVIATAQSYTSPFSVSMTRAWNVGCTAVNLTVNIQATANFTSTGALVFRTVMVERLIQFSVQPGTNGEKDFEDVAIKSFPTLQNGVAMASAWTVGQTQTFTLNCPLPSYTRKKSEVAFVGFIQDDGTRKVAQAVRVGPAAVPSESLAALGASVNLSCNSSITPTVVIRNDGPAALNTFTVNPYSDNTAGTPVVWSGNLAVGAQTTMVLGAMPLSSPVTGAHTFSFSVDLTAPQYNLNVSLNKAPYFIAADYLGTPVSEGFTATAFPPAKWGVLNSDFGPGFSRTNQAGGFNTSTESTKYDAFNNTVMGDVDELYLPPMDLTGTNPDPTLTFDVAYAQRDVNSSEKLQFFVSDNCGAGWTKVYEKEGPALATFTADYAVNPYLPDPFETGHWRKETVALPGFNKAQVLSKFVVTNSHGNNIYLDNVNLSKDVVSDIAKQSAPMAQISVYPNPNNGQATMNVSSKFAEMANVAVYNTLGQLVYTKQLNLTTGLNSTPIDLKDLSAGVYTLLLNSEHQQGSSKLILK